MLFSERDIDLLRLLRWCRCILRKDAEHFFSREVVFNLLALSFVKQYEAYEVLILTTQGNRFLERHFSILPRSAPLAYKTADTKRRLRISKLMLTAYRAGVDVFVTDIKNLAHPPALFLPSLMRGRGRNPWGNTRTAAVARLGELSCSIHCICPGVGKLLLTDELTAFANNTGVLKARRQALIFAGSSYGEIVKELAGTDATNDKKWISYGEAYWQATVPVYLLPCDDSGAQQLRMMNIPNYRERVTAAALKTHYEAPPKDVPEWDAFYNGIPFVMAADLDLRRVDAAVRAAQIRGFRQIALAVLEAQIAIPTLSKYRDMGIARVFTLTDAALAELGCGEASLRTPSRRQFLTEKGDVIDAPPIQTH